MNNFIKHNYINLRCEKCGNYRKDNENFWALTPSHTALDWAKRSIYCEKCFKLVSMIQKMQV